MNISYHWLQQYLDFEQTPEQLAVLLTGCGLEVENIEPFESVKGGLKGLVVGEVLETQKHPNADKLTICKVNVGNPEPSQIVCGAPNVAAGQKVIVATPGTTIFPLKGDPFEIKKSKIRGEESAGMICAEDEIGLGESHDGILVLSPDAVPGSPVNIYFNVENDFTLSIGLTPNRSDAASHIGVARDLRAVLNTKADNESNPELQLRWPDINAFTTPSTQPVVRVKVEHEACYRYSGVHIANVKVAPSPVWLQNRLKAIGLNPINNIVDITNFVLYEMGQPLHAFDAGKISGKEVIVKSLPRDTTFTTLDGIERKLNGTELMICDSNGGMCIAGVFGGIGSGVNDNTTEIFLESAYFDSVSVRKTSKYHGLKTDASFRFERGTDPNMTLTALKRATLLICELAGGTVSSAVVDIYPNTVSDWKLDYDFRNFNKLTGVEIPKESFIQILKWLDIKVAAVNNDLLSLEIPPYRVDVTREADVTEEVLRIIGYDQIPLPAKMNASLPSPSRVPLEKTRRDAAAWLVANGFFEIMCNSLYRSSAFDANTEGLARIKNPLSQDLDIMRPNMLFPMLDTALYNRNRKRTDLKLFEFGKTYSSTAEGYTEINHLAILLTGNNHAPHWNEKQQGYSVYDLKSVVDNLMIAARVRQDKLKWEITENEYTENTLVLKSGKREIAFIGAVRKKLLKKFDLDGVVWFADINLDMTEIALQQEKPRIAEPPKFPEVQRDLSMVLDRSIDYRSLENLAFETERKILRDVNLFDVYQGDKIESGKKSYALSFTLRDDEKTLTDKEIDKVMSRLMDAFEKKLGAVIRGRE
jgi:phenylalanyl-tRNA synthetase beta chain